MDQRTGTVDRRSEVDGGTGTVVTGGTRGVETGGGTRSERPEKQRLGHQGHVEESGSTKKPRSERPEE